MFLLKNFLVLVFWIASSASIFPACKGWVQRQQTPQEYNAVCKEYAYIVARATLDIFFNISSCRSCSQKVSIIPTPEQLFSNFDELDLVVLKHIQDAVLRCVCVQVVGLDKSLTCCFSPRKWYQKRKIKKAYYNGRSYEQVYRTIALENVQKFVHVFFDEPCSLWVIRPDGSKNFLDAAGLKLFLFERRQWYKIQNNLQGEQSAILIDLYTNQEESNALGGGSIVCHFRNEKLLELIVNRDRIALLGQVFEIVGMYKQ